MRRPLQNQIWYPFLALNVVSVSLLAVWLAYWHAQQIQDEIDLQSKQVMTTLQKSNYPLSHQVLSRISDLSGFQVVIFSKEGKIIDTSLDNTDENHRLLANTLADNREGHQVTLNNETYFHSTKTLAIMSSDDERVFHLLYPVNLYNQALWSAVIPAITIGLVICILSGALAFYLARRISKPLQAVARQLGTLTDNHITLLSEPEHDDELRDVVKSVNQLTKDIEELRQRIKQSERLAILGQLSAGVMHHLRNDIAGARLALQVHQRVCHNVDPESLDVAVRQLQLSAEHLQSFLTSGNLMQPVMELLDLRFLLIEVIELFGPQFDHHQIKLNSDIEEKRMSIQGDSAQLRQVIACLVQNGLEAAGPQGNVWINLSSDRKQARIAVGDSGPGVSDADRDSLFEPFFTTKSTGIGLGLAAAKQIVTTHHGSIQFDRRDNVTWFTIYFPISDAEMKINL